MDEGAKAAKVRAALNQLKAEYAAEGKATDVVLTLAEMVEFPSVTLARLYDILEEAG